MEALDMTFLHGTTWLDAKKRKHLARIGSPRVQLTAANQEWALDFAHDVVAAGRGLEASRGGPYGGRRSPGVWRIQAHDLRLEGEVRWHGRQ